MSTNKHASKAADLVKQFKFDPKEFPELIERLEKNCLRYYANSEDWMKVEEKFIGENTMLGYFVEDLIHKQQYDLGLSIIQRNNLLKEGFIKKQDILDIVQPYFGEKPEKTFKYIPNNLFEKDGFGPSEEMVGHDPAVTCWNLKDFGMD